jgi:hypothetical protein
VAGDFAKDLAGSVVCLNDDKNKTRNLMKISKYIVIAGLVLALDAASGQTQPPSSGFQQRLATVVSAAGPKTSETGLTRFNLDFPGGTPKQLVAAIQKAMGIPLNAIVPTEFVDTKLPELKMNNVNVKELFDALEATSLRQEAYISGSYYGGGMASPSHSYQVAQVTSGFKTVGAPTDDSIWYFYVQKPAFPPLSQPAKVCRFYALAPFLERGQTVDDITTAIQTGWKMLGDKDNPTINYHKDTKLLIAVGEENKLATIDAVLKALDPNAQSDFGGRLRAPRSFPGFSTPSASRSETNAPPKAKTED